DKLFKEKYGKPRPEKKRRTYLYLTSFIFKIPFELKDDDDIFLVQSPELLTENRPVSMKKVFQKNSRIKKYHKPGFRPSGFIEKLRDIEIKESPGTDPPVYAALQDLDLTEDEKIYFGGKYIQEEKVPYSPSLWILGSSGMYESAFFKDDMNHALKYFDKVYYGPGIFTIGPQKGSISTVHFLKTLLESRNSELDLRGKFVNALKAQKTNYPYELDWVGYRLYTNCYLAD
ncbi:MAG TPA: hypothetical protein PL169_22600, partial [Leptospiraceae bacterium]|nr:hypothetical protein [Leptospiraceae bacterium]